MTDLFVVKKKKKKKPYKNSWISWNKDLSYIKHGLKGSVWSDSKNPICRMYELIGPEQKVLIQKCG